MPKRTKKLPESTAATHHSGMLIEHYASCKERSELTGVLDTTSTPARPAGPTSSLRCSMLATNSSRHTRLPGDVFYLLVPALLVLLLFVLILNTFIFQERKSRSKVCTHAKWHPIRQLAHESHSVGSCSLGHTCISHENYCCNCKCYWHVQRGRRGSPVILVMHLASAKLIVSSCAQPEI